MATTKAFFSDEPWLNSLSEQRLLSSLNNDISLAEKIIMSRSNSLVNISLNTQDDTSHSCDTDEKAIIPIATKRLLAKNDHFIDKLNCLLNYRQLCLQSKFNFIRFHSS